MRFVVDENYNHILLRGLLQILPTLDIVRVQELGLGGISDPNLLEWAAQERRILLTHDIRTMRKHAEDRMANGLPMPGVIIVTENRPNAELNSQLSILLGAGKEDDFINQIQFVPF